jgi:hypothetical protein
MGIIKNISNKILDFFKNNKQNIFLNSVIFFVFSLFLILKGHRLLIGGLSLFAAGVLFLIFNKVNNKRDNYRIFTGFLLVGFGVFSLIFNYNITKGLIFFVFMAIISFIMINKVHSLIKFMWVSLYFYGGLTLIRPLSSDVLEVIFFRNLPPTDSLLLLILGIIFICIALYFAIELILFYISKIKIFQKLYNHYFIVSLMIIIIVMIAGIPLIREKYINDYPFDLKIGPNENVIGKIYDCISRKGHLYFVEDDWVECKANLGLKENYTFNNQESKLNVRKDHKWQEYNLSYYTYMGNNTLTKFEFMLDKNYDLYHLNLVYYDENKEPHYTGARIVTNTLSKEEFNHKLWERIITLGALFSIILFSVFSAMANLKKILEVCKK